MANIEENPKELDGAPDLCQLIHLGESNVLKNLAIRYKNGQIYTSTTAKVLIAVNPYENVAENDSLTTLAKYQAASVNLEGILTANDLSPHVFSCGHATYHNMVAFGKNQSIIVCGESGSGKTESAKLMMKFLAYTSTVTAVEPREYAEAQRIGDQVLDANPILESFGNAKTVLNNNSSRFGKFTKMMFAPRAQGGADRQLKGAMIETYLLEKSRVCHQDAGERNYHVFYYVCSQAKTRPELRLGDGNPRQFAYLNQSGCFTSDGDATSDQRDFQTLERAMEVMEFTVEERAEVFSIVAGILHLGNIQFAASASPSRHHSQQNKDKGESCSIKDPTPLNNAATLLGLDVDGLKRRLLQREIHVNGATITKDRNKEDAEANRDSIGKAAYNGLFRWIVARINQTSCPGFTQGKEGQSDTWSWVGILDVFGFEIFTQNSFEQFCINFANERLQAYFNLHVLKAEQELYRREALLWTPIDLPDNSDVIEVIMKKPMGVMSLLDSACMQPKGSDQTFTETLFQQHPHHKRLERVQLQRSTGATLSRSSPSRGGTKRPPPRSQLSAVNGFMVRHYAGNVTYDARGFLAKNTDSSHPGNVQLFCDSMLPICSKLLVMTADGRVGERPESNSSMKFRSTSAVFSAQLDKLIETLDATTPYFVRCIKPNPDKAAKKFVAEYVRPQLRYGGVIEALRILKCGFPTRCSYQKIYKLFGSVIEERYHDGRVINKRDFTEAMVRVCGPEHIDRTQYQLGLTMIFFRPGRQSFFQKILALSCKDITPQQRDQIARFLVHKKMIRMKGTVRAALRVKHFHILLKFRKAARTMRVVYKTMIRCLRRVRSRLDSRHQREEEERLAKDKQYLSALAAARELEQQQARWAVQLREKDSIVDQARREASDLNAQMRGLMAKMQTLTARVVEMEGQLQSEKEASRSVLAEKTTLNTNLQAALRDAEAARKQMQELKTRLQTEAQRGEEAERQAREAQSGQAQLAALQREHERAIDQLKGELQRSAALTTEAEQKIRDLQHDQAQHVEHAEADRERLAQRLSDLESQLEQAYTEKEHVLEEAAKRARELATERTARNTESRQAAHLHTQLDSLTSEVQRIQAEFEAVVGEKRKTDEIQSRLQAELTHLRGEKDEREAERTRAARNASDFEARIRVLQATDAEKTAELEALRRGIAEKAQAENDLAVELRKLREESKAVKLNVAGKDKAIRDAERLFNETVQTHKEMVAKVERKFAKVTAQLEQETRAEINTLRTEATTARRELRVVQAREAAARQDLTLANQKIVQLTQELADAHTAADRAYDLEDEVSVQNDNLANCKRQAKAWVVTFDMLKAQAELEFQRLDRVERVSATRPNAHVTLTAEDEEGDGQYAGTLSKSLSKSLAGTLTNNNKIQNSKGVPTLDGSFVMTPTKVKLHAFQDHMGGLSSRFILRGAAAGAGSIRYDVSDHSDDDQENNGQYQEQLCDDMQQHFPVNENGHENDHRTF